MMANGSDGKVERTFLIRNRTDTFVGVFNNARPSSNALIPAFGDYLSTVRRVSPTPFETTFQIWSSSRLIFDKRK